MAVAGLQGVTDATRKQLEKYQAGYNASAVVNAAQQQMQQAQAAKPASYTPSATVLQAQQKMQQTQAAKPADYTPGATVVQAQQKLKQIQNNQPGPYKSKYADQLDSILAQIQNPEEFKYEFNGDNLFKAYADIYTQKGKQAAADVQGQAAAMTGGYGNSYGVTAGNQAYQQYLTDLYGVGLDLRDRAYQDYLNKLQNKKDVYGLMSEADATEYGRYRDTVGDWKDEMNYYTDRYDTEKSEDYSRYRDKVGDWQTELGYYTDRYDTEKNADYNRYRDLVGDWENERNYYTNRYDAERDYDTKMYQFELEYWTGLAEIENADYNSQLEREEAIREYNEKMELERQKLEEDKRRYDQEWAHQLELEAAAAAAAASGGGGGNGGGGGDEYTPPTQSSGGTSFKDATNAVQNAKLYQSNLPASSLNKNLSGTVGDFVSQATQKAANLLNTASQISKVTPAATSAKDKLTAAANKLKKK